MKISEVKQYAKKDESATYYMALHRKLGLYVAWMIVKIFPSISANTVTISTLPLNILSATILYFAIVSSSYSLLFVAFIISFFTFTLDCSDGNIARIKKSASIKGVYYDRLVHNLSHPLFYFVIGFGLYSSTDHIIYLIIFLVVGILSELSPLDVSQKDVETLFIRQAVLHSTINYNKQNHQFRESSHNQQSASRPTSKVKKIIKTILEDDSFYLMLLLDLILFNNQYYLSISLALIVILGRVVIKLDIKKWESNLHEVLEKIDNHKSQL
ncbi:CDP-alcohol phosphatidyltransferase family protein [Ornithinibacillus halotolerans]|uniref:CDP-alcohol phosphatidyltransferase family protein n=1 Tax=Ornithinibacillus halotolerans TaxID=1274357 RepID=A0A916RVQ1_9BACI|nr:CDP-alcohol phosphatidyltransferase family protein [Ornithinibacillus halotolerans]GGA72950.1 hypothetical protein GCM10008025_15910 [Ornithinibacillus halotolerans]